MPYRCRKTEQTVAFISRNGHGGEIVESMLGNLDDVRLDEFRALLCSRHCEFQSTFPFEDCPAREIVLCHLGKDGPEIDLTVSQRAEASSALDPSLVAAVHALAPRGAKLGVLDVKCPDPLVVDIDELKVVELLKQHVARVVENVGPSMTVDGREEPLERDSVEQVFPRM